MKNDNKTTLEELLNQLKEIENIEQSQKDKLNLIFQRLHKPSIFSLLIRKIKFFIKVLIFNFIGFYLAYGVFMFDYISVSKINAIYLVLILSSIKALYRTLRINRINNNLFINSFCSLLFLILIVYYFSNLRFLFYFKSFSSIIIYFILGQLITDIQEIIVTIISLERRLL